MKHSLILSGFLLGAAFLAPVTMSADDHDKRYYHREGRDYHLYDHQEDRAYRVYLGEQHRDFVEFRRMKHKEQEHYFRWRHEHSDHVLFKLEVK